MPWISGWMRRGNDCCRVTVPHYLSPGSVIFKYPTLYQPVSVKSGKKMQSETCAVIILSTQQLLMMFFVISFACIFTPTPSLRRLYSSRTATS